jgi:hypothetical protein
VNIFKTLKNYLLSVAGNEWIEGKVSKWAILLLRAYQQEQILGNIVLIW